VLGNHEGTGSSSTNFFSEFFPRGSANGFPLNYSYAYGNALIIQLNANYTSRSQLESQASWVATEARSAKAFNPDGSQKFIIVVLHKSPYGGEHAGSTVTSSGTFGARNIRDYLAPALQTAGVDLVLAGHDHNFIRSYPIKNGTWDPSKIGSVISSSQDGIVYYIPRNSGEKTYNLVEVDARHHPWINIYWNQGEDRRSTTDPKKTVFSAITVSQTEISVDTWLTGSTTDIPEDHFVITK
jgi:hypothetical protein